MEICASTFLIKSRTTETTIRIEVPPRAKVVFPVMNCITKGKTATIPKNVAPKRVIRLNTFEMYSEVETPGRIPGIKAPFFCKLVERASGSKVTAV